MFPFARLVGGVGTLNTPNPILTVGSYLPYATTIWDFINRAMPRYAPRTLSPDDVYALTAFILFKNGIIKETDVMDKNSLVEVQMPNRDGFYPDPHNQSRIRTALGCPFGIKHLGETCGEMTRPSLFDRKDETLGRC